VDSLPIGSVLSWLAVVVATLSPLDARRERVAVVLDDIV
jgi:hypothetical protein